LRGGLVPACAVVSRIRRIADAICL
jgi:hypothetical protein